MFGGYVSGYAEGKKTGGLDLALPFLLGNALTLAVVGVVASLMGNSALRIFSGYQLDRWIPGIVGLLMGFQLLGILRLKMPVMPIFRWARQPGTSLGSFALGLPFGLVVTPCTMWRGHLNTSNGQAPFSFLQSALACFFSTMALPGTPCNGCR
jgi:cytochrome c-type biogenesis protein